MLLDSYQNFIILSEFCGRLIFWSEFWKNSEVICSRIPEKNPLIDGQIIGTVEVFHEVYCYFSCENCTCSIDEDVTYCPKCKKNTNSKKDFKYEVLIKMENGKCDGGVGFRQSLSMEGIEVDSNAEMLEDD